MLRPRLGSRPSVAVFRRALLGTLAVAAIALGLVTAAGATGTLDQQQTSSTGGTNFAGTVLAAQTFTAGQSGLLDQVEVQIGVSGDAGPLIVEIRNVTLGVPSGPALASRTFTSTETAPVGSGAWFPVAFSTPAAVSSGTKYAIVLAAPTPGSGPCCVPPSYGWAQANNDTVDPYSGGEGLQSIDSGTSWENPQPSGFTDHAFKTYVSPAVATLSEFAAPIDADVVNSAKAGQTIPVKWRLTNADGSPVSDPASFVSLGSQSAGGDCAGLPTDAIETYATNSGLKYLGDGNWQFNWATPKSYSGQCRTMKLTLAGGITRTASFQFK